jgi:ABC-type nitrate/sulfonate/bicarbonate transport system substrate-binding protein
MAGRRPIALVVLIVLALLLLTGYSLLNPRPKVNVTLGDIGRGTATSLVYAYGAEKGIFEKHDLNVSHVPFRDAYTLYLNLFTGKVDMTSSSPGRIATAHNEGEALRIGMALAESKDFALLVRPGISTMSDLWGKRIGVMGQASDAFNILRWYCDGLGLDLEEDFDLVEIKNPANLVTAFKTGDVEGVALWGAFGGEVIDSGGVVLMTFSEALQEVIGLPHYMNLVIMRGGFLDDPRVADNFLKAVREIVSEINSNQDEAGEIWARFADEPVDKMQRALGRMNLVGEMNESIETEVLAFFQHAAQEGYLEEAPGEEIFYTDWT